MGSVIRPEVDGLLVRPGNVDALTAALDRLMADAAVKVQFAARAVKTWESFRWKGSLGCGKSFLRSYGSDDAPNRSRSRRSI